MIKGWSQYSDPTVAFAAWITDNSVRNMQGNTIAFINKEHVFSPSGITLRRFINGCFLDLSGSAVAALMHSSTGPQKPVLSVPPIPPIPSISPIPSIEPVQPVWPIPPLRGSSTKWEDFIGA
ncbi:MULTISPECIES: 4-fold beta flower protein [Corynebacterium]|uniref:4-fold beta flower protein n=1 Tax=Corynebacterium TaxID=1716 RepID=UPI0037C02335